MLQVPSAFCCILKLSRLIPKGLKNMLPRFFSPPSTSVFIFSNFSAYNFSRVCISLSIQLNLGSSSLTFFASFTASSQSSLFLKSTILQYTGLRQAGSSSIAAEKCSSAFRLLTDISFVSVPNYYLLVSFYVSCGSLVMHIPILKLRMDQCFVSATGLY